MDQIVGSGAVDTLSLPKVKDSLAEAIVGLIRWFTKNWANTHEPTHKDLAPIILPLPLDASIELVKTKVSEMPRWKVEESPKPNELHLTRQTRTIRFVDDVVLTFQTQGSSTKIDAASKSRVGLGDLGQNRRNILELWKAIGK
jgi:uncharacterized protein (DUF1499 family)